MKQGRPDGTPFQILCVRLHVPTYLLPLPLSCKPPGMPGLVTQLGTVIPRPRPRPTAGAPRPPPAKACCSALEQAKTMKHVVWSGREAGKGRERRRARREPFYSVVPPGRGSERGKAKWRKQGERASFRVLCIVAKRYAGTSATSSSAAVPK